jgi:phage-related protein
MKLFNGLIDWMDKNVLGALRYLFGPLGDILYAPISVFVNAVKGAFESLFGGVKQIVNGIVKLFKGDFKGAIVNVFGGLKSIMLAPINALISGINSLIKGVNKISFDVPGWVPVIGGKKWGFNIPKIPKLAKGTILNNPGKGVPVAGGSAIAGEAGREAYLPLSDTQLLEELGSTIGRYITINLTNVTELDGRQIARKVDKIQQNNNFVFNR